MTTQVNSRPAATPLGSVAIVSDDQSIWSGGPAPRIGFNEYFPIIGGERETFAISNARVSRGEGRVEVHAGGMDRLSYDPGDAYAALGEGDVRTVVVAYSLIGPDGGSVDREVVIEARGAAGGTTYTIPRTGQTATAPFSFAATDADAVLNDPYVLARVTPIDIEWDLFAGLHQASADARILQVAFAAGARADTLRLTAETARWTADRAADLHEAWREAEIEEEIARAAKTAAAAAFHGADFALGRAEEVATGAYFVYTELADAASDAWEFIKDFAELIFSVWPWEYARLISEARRIAQETQREKESAYEEYVRKARDLANIREAFGDAEEALDRAEEHLKTAVDVTAKAAAEFNDFVGNRTAAELESLAATAERARDDAAVRYDEALERVWDAGILPEGERPDLIGSIVNMPLDVLGTVLDGTDFVLDVAASVAIDVQAGLQVDLLVDGGSIDSRLAYDVGAGAAYDEASDRLTLSATATNAVTGETVAFETVSPNASFYAGVVYDIAATFEIVFDLLASAPAALNLPNLDLDFAIEETLHEAGWIDVLDFDTRTADLTYEPPIPGWLGGIFSVRFAFPTIETDGTAIEPTRETLRDIYRDPEPFDIDRLAELLLDVIEAKINYGPEFMALLKEKGLLAPDSDGVQADDLGDLALAILPPLLVLSMGAGFPPALAALPVFAPKLREVLDLDLDAVDLDTVASLIGELLTGGADKDGDGLTPLFQYAFQDGTGAPLIHIDAIADPVDEIDLANVGKLGLFFGSGESANVFEVEVDVDQLLATVVNVALGNAPDTTVNPFDLSFALSDVLDDLLGDDAGKSEQETASDGETRDFINEVVAFDVALEAADLDVRAGANVHQDFALSVDDMLFDVLFEDGTAGQFTAAGGGTLVVEDASSLEDTDGNGMLDYVLSLIPDATLFNDTEVALNLGYTLDFVKAKANFLANLPLGDIFADVPGALDLISALDLPSEIGFDLGFGPVLRLEGDLDVLTADVFEDVFAFDAGIGTIAGAIDLIAPQVRGMAEADTLIGTTGDDVMRGLEGGDALFGRKGDDRLEGDEGNDRLYGGTGIDTLAGGAGSDTAFGGVDDDRLSGEAGDDELFGGEGADLLEGGQGDDVLRGGGGGDILFGDEGADRLSGNEGDDDIEGGAGSDRLFGGEGSDRLVGGLGADELFGGAGNDAIEGEAGDDRLFGMGDDDLIAGGEGADTAFGGPGDDSLYGEAGDDLLRGGDGGDLLEGGAGDDRLSGGEGSDLLIGGPGSDELFGGDGDDVLDGGVMPDQGGGGTDRATGGGGADTFVFESSDTRLVITDFDFAEGDRVEVVGPLDLAERTVTDIADGHAALVTFDGRFGGGEGIRFDGVRMDEVRDDWFV